MPPATLAAMMQIAPRLGQALTRAVNGSGFNLHLANGPGAGQAMPHTHLHIIPRLPADGFAWGWRCRDYSEAQKLAIQQKVAARMQNAE